MGTAAKSKLSRVFPGSSVFHQGAEQAGSGPAFLVGLFGKARPERLDGGQAQLVQGKGEAGGVDIWRCHAAAPLPALLSSRS
jgi:hypothetical protein